MSEFIGESTIVVRADTRPFFFRIKKDIEAIERKTATIIVRADTKLFRSQVREVTAETNKFVRAKVIVEADTRAFMFGVKRAAAAAQEIPFTVTVNAVPSMTGFQKSLREGVNKSSATVVARVRVVPDLKGFRERLRTEVKASSTGVVAPVAPAAGAAAATTRTAAPAAAPQPVVVATPVSAAPALAQSTKAAEETAKARDKTTAATKRATVAETRFQEALTKTAFARQAPSGATRQERLSEALARQQIAARGAAKAYEAALAEQNLALARNAREMKDSLAADIAKTKSTLRVVDATQKASTAAGRGVAQTAVKDPIATNVARSAELQADAEKRLQASLAAGLSLSERKAELDKARSVASAGVAAAEKAAALATDTGNKELIASTKAGTAAAEATKTRTLASAADLRTLQKAESAIAVSAQKAALSTGEIVGAKSEEDAANQRLRLSRAAAAKALEAETLALQIQNPLLQENILLRARSQIETTKATTAELGSAAARVAANKSVKESILANTLSLLGLRGSALAANAAFLGTSAALITLAKSVGLAAKFSSTLNTFRVTAGATADEMTRVTETARQLGADVSLPGVSAQSAAEGMTELSKAGLSVQDSIDGVRGVLQLATAAGIDNAEATELAASALNAFGLAGDQAVRVADTLANAANDSQGSIVDIGTALSQSAAVARQAGLSLEQTVAALTLFARAGLRGSDAGTSFRTALIRLINPTTKAQKVIDELGLNLRTATGGINLNVFDEFAQKTRDLTKAQRDQALAVIFGQDAIRGAAILARSGASGLNAQITSLEKTGTAANLAAARMSGLAGAAENLKNQLSTLGLALGNVVAGPLTLFANTIGQVASNVNATNEAIRDLINNAKRIAGSVPQIKLGPIDTGEVDKQTSSFLEKNAKKIAPIVAGAAVSPAATLVALDPVGKGLEKLGFFARDASKEVQKVLDRLNEQPDLPGFNEAIVRLQKMQGELSQGTKEEQKFAKGLGPLIDRLQKLANQKPIKIPFTVPDVKLPANLGGQAGSDAGQAVIDGLQRKLAGADVFGLTKSFYNRLAVASTTSSERFSHTGELTGEEFGKSLQRGLTQAFLGSLATINQGAQALIDEMNRVLIAGGGPAQQNAVLEKQLADARRRERVATERLGTLPKGPSKARARAKKELSTALADQAQLAGQIKSNNDQITADAKQKADDIQESRDKADQAFLDALQPAQSRLERRSIRAEKTTDLADNLAVLRAQRARTVREIALIDEGIKDRKVAEQQIDQRRTTLEQIDNNIASLEQQMAEQRFERQQSRFETRLNAAQAVGDITGQIRITNARIKKLNEMIRLGRVEGALLRKAVEERNKLRDDRDQLFEDRLQGQVDFARSVFELTGNKNPLLKAIDAEIKNTAKQIAAAKKAGRDTTALRTELNNWLIERKNVLEDAADKAKQGTTAFDLLKQFSDRFNEIAGNLINVDQPFAGPTGFTADIAQFLKRRQGAGATGAFAPGRGPLEDPVRGGFRFKRSDVDKQISSNDSLIAALDKLTQVILSESGNDTTNGKGAGTVKQTKGNPWAGRRWFVESHAARGAQEG
jgi:TP901 family phage tail tape measure protein